MQQSISYEYFKYKAKQTSSQTNLLMEKTEY